MEENTHRAMGMLVLSLIYTSILAPVVYMAYAAFATYLYLVHGPNIAGYVLVIGGTLGVVMWCSMLLLSIYSYDNNRGL